MKSSQKGTSTDPKGWLEKAANTSWATKLKNSDVLVLALGCTLTKDNKHLANASKSSLQAGVSAYTRARRNDETAQLVCVGAGYHQHMTFYEYGLMMNEASRLGVKESDLFGEPHSYNTVMNAVCIAVAIKDKTFKKIILTADPIHMERAFKTFTEVFRVMGISTPIECLPGPELAYGDSSKWFLRRSLFWRIWNKVGLKKLPEQIKKLEEALKA